MMRTEIPLGTIDLPDGVLVILDPGLSRYWRHEGAPSSPRKSDPAEYDLVISGDDAEAAGTLYDREFVPLHLYDRRDPEDAKAHFDGFAVKNGLKAQASILEDRLPHSERAKKAIAAGEGLGVVKYNGLWGVVAGDLARSEGLRVVGVPLPEGEFGGRWQYIDVIVDETAPVSDTIEVQGVMVDHGQLMFTGLRSLGSFRMWESLDGLGDYLFWGRDAESLATEVGASHFAEKRFGWKDLVIDEIGAKAQYIQKRIQEQKLQVEVDYRPHCNLERLNAAMRASSEDCAQISVNGSDVVGCGNRWGDGVFSVSKLTDADGNVVRIRVNLGTEERQELMRQVRVRDKKAMLTRSVVDDGEPIRFAKRMAAGNPKDSGWLLCSGTEDEAYLANASNFVPVQISVIVERHPEFAEIIAAPEGAQFHREGKRLVADE